jgi:membrane protein YdbS with pleckstrin-like domain
MDPTRRLLFWLKIPYVADAALVVIGIGLLIAGNGVGWWVLVFAAVRAVVGTIALVWIAPRMISDKKRDDRAAEESGTGAG